MGEIYLARTRGMAGFEKNCIIKTILPHLAEEEEFVTKFLDEGRIVVQLVHGNIVPVFDMGDEGGEVARDLRHPQRAEPGALGRRGVGGERGGRLAVAPALRAHHQADPHAALPVAPDAPH